MSQRERDRTRIAGTLAATACWPMTPDCEDRWTIAYFAEGWASALVGPVFLGMYVSGMDGGLADTRSFIYGTAGISSVISIHAHGPRWGPGSQDLALFRIEEEMNRMLMAVGFLAAVVLPAGAQTSPSPLDRGINVGSFREWVLSDASLEQLEAQRDGLAAWVICASFAIGKALQKPVPGPTVSLTSDRYGPD